ncbi:MAG: hypothetical protein CFE24_13345 [Flavobacterium sp. BFFFF2]|nr:MAG: hypothetical protein CFE24_13345 [Flavobacterium sp. BFFFF2]
MEIDMFWMIIIILVVPIIFLCTINAFLLEMLQTYSLKTLLKIIIAFALPIISVIVSYSFYNPLIIIFSKILLYGLGITNTIWSLLLIKRPSANSG